MKLNVENIKVKKKYWNNIVNEQNLKKWNNLIYLGSIITNNGRCTQKKKS